MFDIPRLTEYVAAISDFCPGNPPPTAAGRNGAGDGAPLTDGLTMEVRLGTPRNRRVALASAPAPAFSALLA
jgi:hypothetical protein